MNVDLEASGALATAGLAAKAIDDQSASSNAHAASVCANCKATLLGAYCHVCGQTGHVHRSIWHMLEEGLHGVLHFDSKIWRTLPLLFARPGLLTRRYIDGQRVRYVSPLALFLFTIFLMFFVLSFAGSGGSTTQATPEEQKNARDQIVAELETAKAEVAKQSALIAAAPAEAARQKAAEDLEGAQIEQRAAEVQLSIFDKATALDADPSKTALVTAEELKALTGIQFDKGTSKAGDVLKDLTRNPELMIYKFRNTSYKF
ncbi:MAG TPA: DUF3667 domain-containing protein, partial [Steroidobacteraceae bacterium]|nr:DUF3667 domain-containing protein [Steroidobacteraceae bacterium]